MYMLDTETCRSLIDKKALVEIGSNHMYVNETGSGKNTQSVLQEERWIYAADPRLFAPRFQIEESDGKY